jgi:AraC-like DNA-binding protein
MLQHPPASDALRSPPDAHLVADIVPYMARSLLGLMEDRGVPLERLCRGLGFTHTDLLDSHLLLSHNQVRSLVLRAQQLARDPALAIACGARQTPMSWGLLGLAMLTCETFGEAIEYGLSQQGAGGAMLHNVFEMQGGEARLEVLPRLFDLEIEAFLVEENFAGAVAIARCLVGHGFAPLRVDLAFARPAHAEAYQRFFRCPVRFDAGCNRLTMESHWLGARLPGYDRITCGLVRAQLNTLLHQPVGRNDLVESLANRMRMGVEEGARQTDLAQMVNVSARTLRRRLESQSVSYRALRDETRFERARDLLAHTPLTMAQVADAVGYSDARAFRRAFKRWSGELPGQYRMSARASVRSAGRHVAEG